MDDSKKMKEHLLMMFSWFHDICEENQLRYYVLGGTMLGAVRHGGFIPWDDDIDVGMPRQDYIRLAQLMKKAEKAERYILETPDTDASDYFYLYSKIYDTTTTLIENRHPEIKRGLYIDIFPLDGLGASKEEARQRYDQIERKSNLLLARTTGIRKGRSPLKNSAAVISRFIPSFIVNNKSLLHNIDAECQEGDFDNDSWGGNLVGAWRFREIMPRSVMGTPTLYQFENMKVYGAEDADAYLTSLYGNWRKLPPIEQQISRHDFVFLDMETSYLD